MRPFSTLVPMLLLNCVRCHDDLPEFGRYPVDSKVLRRNRVSILESQREYLPGVQNGRTNLLTEKRVKTTVLQDIFESHRFTMETSMSFSLSMSMTEPPTPSSPTTSNGPPTSDTIAPVGIDLLGPPGPPGPPTTGPLVPPIPTISPIPTIPPSPSSETIPPVFPFLRPTLPPSTPRPQPTIQSSSSAPSRTSVDCESTNTLKLVSASNQNATPIVLEMSYNTESSSSSIENFQNELADELIRTAAFAIFGCNPLTGNNITQNTESINNETCIPTENATNSCFVMETAMIIGIEGEIDTYTADKATFDAYSAIRKGMTEGRYIRFVPTLVSLEFVSPDPLIEPEGNGPPDQIDTSDLQRDVDVSPWTIGFSVASVMGGFVSLLVYARSRKRRRDLLEETTPWVSPENGDSVI